VPRRQFRFAAERVSCLLKKKSLDALGEDVSAAPLPCCNEAINIAILEKTNQHCSRRAGWIW
jgi:hypothetical protein